MAYSQPVSESEVFIFTQPLDGALRKVKPLYSALVGGSHKRTTEHWGVLVCPPSVPAIGPKAGDVYGLRSSTLVHPGRQVRYIEGQFCAAAATPAGQNNENIPLGTCYELDIDGKFFQKGCQLLISSLGTERVRAERISAYHHLGSTRLRTQAITYYGCLPSTLI